MTAAATPRALTTLETTEKTAAYEHYLRVRDWAARMKARLPVVPTHAERTIADALAPIWDATPDMIAGLRGLAQPLGGSDPEHYRDSESADAKTIRRDLKRLVVQVGSDLFVPEPAILGGFGCRTTGGRANTDTVRFFSAMVALDDGAVLAGFRQPQRRVVWEIGGGWGGFAYQFKTLFPNVSYVITGSPESLLFSAIYVMTAFPDARVEFYEDSQAATSGRDWDKVDFVFAPERALDRLRFPRLDLTLDVQALMQLTPDRIERHVRHAFDADCRYFFSLHHGDWASDEIPTWRAIDARYWLHPVPARIQLRKGRAEYSHVIGWKRMQA